MLVESFGIVHSAIIVGNIVEIIIDIRMICGIKRVIARAANRLRRKTFIFISIIGRNYRINFCRSYRFPVVS
jgi:hypothetical protein